MVCVQNCIIVLKNSMSQLKVCMVSLCCFFLKLPKLSVEFVTGFYSVCLVVLTMIITLLLV